MSESETPDEGQDTRPISVAEILARHGTIGAPPAGGHRRRRRRRGDSVSVAELTGEIPVIRDEEPPAEAPAEEDADEAADEAADGAVDEAADEAADGAPEQAAPPPLSNDPHPHRGGRPELSHDPRPARRGSGAEQMVPDPDSGAVDLAALVAESDTDDGDIRSYLKSPAPELFSGDSVADDLARGGRAGPAGDPAAPAAAAPRVPAGRLTEVRNAGLAALQSVLAVLFGAGLFVGFDQLWRWNTIVALVLSVLVILGLVIAVRVVRRTEDIASTLIAVAVGALVTLGPLALFGST